MSTLDFRALASLKLNDVKRPPALPAGTYYGVVKQREWGESRFANRETGEKDPALRLMVVLSRAGDDIEPSDLEGIDFAGKLQSKEYNLAEGKQLYALRQTIESVLGEEQTRGRELGETVEELIGQEVMISVTQRPNKKNPEEVFNDISRIAGVGAE